MGDVDTIVKLLGSEAIEKRIAAAIVLGELKPKAAGVAQALARALETDIPLFRRHVLDALARVGAERALDQVIPLLSAHDDDVRRAAIRAVASAGESALPKLRARLKTAPESERRALDAALAEVGGKDAFTTLLRGLTARDPDAARAAALAVRQKVKNADGRQRRSYLGELEKLLASLAPARPTRAAATKAAATKRARGKATEAKHADVPDARPSAPSVDSSAAATAAALKIVGFFEDESTVPLLVRYAADDAAPATVRQEAIIALRFALASAKASAKVVELLVKAAESPDRTLAQTALHTLASLKIASDVAGRLERLVFHREVEVARLAMDLLARTGGDDAAKVLVRLLETTTDKRAAEGAAKALEGNDAAAAPLAKAVLGAKDPDRAWALRSVLRPLAKKVPPALVKELLAAADKRLADGARGWEAALDVAREANAELAAKTLRDLAARLRRGKKDERALAVLRVLAKTEKATDDDRLDLASLELRASTLDTTPAMRARDEALRLLERLARGGLDVGKALKKDRALEPDHLYYVGFHFAEDDHPLGPELLELVVERAGRTKVGKMARNKLGLVSG